MNRKSPVNPWLLKVLAILIMLSCNQGTAKKEKIERTDSTQTSAVNDTAVKVNEPAMLKNVVIDDKYFEHKNRAVNAVKADLVKSLHLDELMKKNDLPSDPNAKIKIIDTLLLSNISSILIVSRETENEQWAWLVHYGNNNSILNSKLLFYQDFVEYFSSTSAKVSDTTITITTVNDSEGDQSTKIEKYNFTNSKLELQK